jgi:hypothetical protein
MQGEDRQKSGAYLFVCEHFLVIFNAAVGVSDDAITGFLCRVEVNKVKIASKQSKQNINDHFVEVNKMVSLGSGSEREIDDIRLTRYACYLIAQNGDSRISYASAWS